MAYERLNLKTGDELNEAVFKKIDDNFEKSVIQENNRNLTTSTDLLKDSFDYWTSYWSNTLYGNKQNFLIDKDSVLLNVVHRNESNSGAYIGSPMIKIDTSLDNVLSFSKSSFYMRHLFIYNMNGDVLFHVGGQITSGTNYFKSGLSKDYISNFIAEEENTSAYPLLCQSLTQSELLLNSDIMKELNVLFLSGELGTVINGHTMGTYIENEPVWIYFNLSVTTRPDLEDDYDNWIKNSIAHVKCIETTTDEIFDISKLAISSRVANKYYESPRLNDVMSEIGEFKTALAIENAVLNTAKKKVIYSDSTIADFFPSAYYNCYLDKNTKITDFETPIYTGVKSYENYKITRPIPLTVTEDSMYEVSGYLRHFKFFDENGASLLIKEKVTDLVITVDYLQQLGLDPEHVKWLVVSNENDKFNASWKVTNIITSTSYTFEMPSLVLTENQLGGVDLSGIGDGYKTVDLTNIDRIVAIGDSYSESHYTIKDKSWLSKLSLLTDYNYDNFAISGDTYRGQLNKIRTGKYAYATKSGMTWEKLHPTHAILISKTNDTKYMSCQQFIYDMTATIETIKGLGAVPIVASEYHVSNHDFIQSAFDYYAKKYGGYYVDLAEKTYTLRGNDYAPFWGGSHPATRTNHLLCDVFIDYVNKNLPRPYSAIKIFRPRDNSLTHDLDNYIFGNIEERAEKFKEISICHSALDNSSLYDNCTGKAQSKIESEYFKIMSGLSVPFDKICLIDVILPTTVHDISQVKLITNNMNGVDCYVKDVLAEPYPSPAFCRRFDIATVLDEAQVAVGNKYTSNKSTGTTYTVKEILYDQVESTNGFVDGTILICSGNKSVNAYDNSTLTLTSGTGDATLSCTYEAVGLSSDYPEGKQDIGHYVLLDEYGVVEGDTLRRAVDCDKITFLLVSDSTFNLNNVEIKFKGDITKTRNTPSYNNTLAPNCYNEQESLIAHKTFDSENISYWLKNNLTDACGLISEVPADNVLPKNISQIVTLTKDDGIIVQSFNKTAAGATHNMNHKVKVWARYFPDIFDSTTMTYPDDSTITDDSFDWAKLNIQLYPAQKYVKNNDSVKMTKLVGLHWTEVEIDITMPSIAATWYLGLSVEDKPIQLAYCDVI
jgi:hypothetical protein